MQRIPALCALLVVGFFAGAFAAGCPEQDEGPDPTGAPLAVVYVDDIGDDQEGSGRQSDPYRSLATAIAKAKDGSLIKILEGIHVAVPVADVDPTCGNCSAIDFAAEQIDVKVAWAIRGKGLHLEGASRTETVLTTNAGYGLYFDGAGPSSVKNLTITGGVRSANGRATDAGIVVKSTQLDIANVDIVGNDNVYPGEPDPIVGIMGVALREGADATVTGCRVENNSWDGISLYRSDPDVPNSWPRATIIGNIVGCTRNCVNPAGRGVGIATTWDSEAVVVGNRVHHMWKGIGTFGESTMIAANNAVIDQVGWGMIASSTGISDFTNNVIARNGTTGLAAWSSGAEGSFINNIVVANGTSADEWVGKKTGLWVNSTKVVIAYNNVSGNASFDVCSGGTPNETPCAPVDLDESNLATSPLFADSTTFTLQDASPLKDRGDPAILDVDGSRSDMGLWGGPHADENAAP